MAKFHINPKTGSPSVCRATEKRGCPYSGVSDHFETVEEARAAYEALQERVAHFMSKTEVPQIEGAITLEVYDPLSDETPPTTAPSGTPDVAAIRFFDALRRAPEGSLLILEDGTIAQKSDVSLYGNETHTLRSPYNPLLRLEVNHSYDLAYYALLVKSRGARLETPPRRLYPETDYLAGVGNRPSGKGLESLPDAEFAKQYADAYNAQASGEMDSEDFRQYDDESARRKGRLNDFLVIGQNGRAKAARNLSLEGIDERRRHRYGGN